MKRKVACEKEGFKTFENKRPRQAGRCLSIAIIFLLLVTPSFLFPQPLYDYVNYVRLLGPSSYPLRWGEKEPITDDMVPLPPGYEDGSPRVYPGCYKIGTSGFSVAYSFKANFDAFVAVTVLDSENKVLYQKVTSFPTPPTGVVTLYDFSLPGYIEELRVIVQWAQWQPAVVIPVFVVLDDPKPPMDPAWVSLLRYSCRWGRGTSNLDDAAQAITFGVFFQRPGFAYPRDTASHWLNGSTFMLRALLDEWNAGRWTDGNCADVSCLTMLALCSVGLDFSVRQLTGTLLPPPPYCGRNCPPPWEDGPIGFHFHTNDICSIGSDPTVDWTYKWWAWAWHQVCVLTGAPDPPSNDAGVWDPTAAQKEDLNGNGYRNPPAHHPKHLWPQKDYWQKPHTQVPNAWLGLVGEPIQSTNDPQLYGMGTWKCGVSADPWIPPP
jgi:hypothetical protein